MTSGRLEPPPPELATLLAAEARDLPIVPDAVRGAIFDRIRSTLGWGGAGGGTGLLLATLVLALGGLAAILAFGPTDHGTPTNITTETQEPSTGRPSRPTLAHDLPTWFGDAARPARAIAGRVERDDRPVAGARVVLQSYATRAGLTPEHVEITGIDGVFDFGEQRAAAYDVTASLPGASHAHLRIETKDPTRAFDRLILTLGDCDHGLRGTVRDAAGGVIAGAEVRPGRGQGIDVTTVGAAATTDDDGTFALCAPPGDGVFIASSDGYGAVVLREHVRGWRSIEVSLLPAGVITGRIVRASDRQPIAAARVWLNPAETRSRQWPYGGIASTDPDGRFRFEGIAAGRYWLWANAEGRAGFGSASATPAHTSRDVVLELEDLGSVAGTVVHDGAPVPGATVRYRVNGHLVGAADITDGAGRFQLLNTGRAAISFDVAGYQVLRPDAHRPGDGPVPVTIEVAPAAQIRGQVVAAGRPVPRARVRAVSGIAIAAEAIADARGAYELSGLQPGTYQLQADSARLAAVATTDAQPAITIAEAEIRDGVVIELDGAAAIEGTVLDESGAAAAGVAVTFRDPSGDRCDAATGEDGAFRCDMLAGRATYQAAVRPWPRAPLALRPARARYPAVELASRDSVARGVILRVQLDRAHIRGRVVGQGGAPANDVTVRAISSRSAYTPATAPWVGFPAATTGLAGEFDLEVTGRGPFTLHARGADGSDAVAAGILPGARDVVLTLTSPGSVRGSLEGFTGRPKVWLRPVGDTEEHILAVVGAGHYSARDLPPGRYGILAATPTEATAAEIDLAAGETRDLPLRARPATPITIAVRDVVSGHPVRGVRCVALPYVRAAGIFGFGVQADGPTDARGIARIQAPGGRIEVTCLPGDRRHSGGAARLETSDAAAVEVWIVAPPDGASGTRIGATTTFAHDEPAGHIHTIAEIRPDGPADRAGLQVGDIIRAVDGHDVTSLIDIRPLLDHYRPGTALKITIVRAGALVSRTVTTEGR